MRDLQDVFLPFKICVMLLTFVYVSQGTKPRNKRQQAIWRLECELGVIAEDECPTDGGWAAWSAWSACRGACDGVGHRARRRHCDNPPPSHDGLPCSGPDEQIQLCYLTNCTVSDYRQLIQGDSARMEAFHRLEPVPALLERCLQMECPYEAIEAALAGDNTWQLNPEALWNSLQCVKHNMGCPVMGEWGGWGSWSACGARCGHGLRWRLRRCDTPPPTSELHVCPGTPLQSEECEGDQCAIDVRDVDNDGGGQWREWGQWTECTEHCGVGVRRRRRVCHENYVTRSVGSWGTHCTGQHDEFEVCESETCLLQGGWSGWGGWGPCSQTCGAGRRSRTRSCTRPIPAGGGLPCTGPRTEIGSCYLNPCEVYSHQIALLNGDSFLQFNFENKRSTLFHFYVRFMPLSPHGTLVRRGAVHSPKVRLSLQKWHLCLDASGSSRSCTLQRICSPFVIEPAIWHTAMITVTSEAATLRLDDEPLPIKGTFSCDPELEDLKMNILIGEKLHGEIQDLALNFIPLDMTMRKRRKSHSDFSPSSASNIAYEKANIDEAFLFLHNDQYLRLPCFPCQDEWRLELTIKSQRESGTIIFFGDSSDNWLQVSLQNMRMKIKMAFGEFRIESSSYSECSPDQWLDLTLSKKREANTIEASINGGEKVHVVLDEQEPSRKHRELQNRRMMNRSKSRSPFIKKHNNCTFAEYREPPQPIAFAICSDEFFVGGIPAEVQHHLTEEFTPFSGLVASVSINNVLQDLHKFSVERCKEGKVQVSSRTASVSGSYHETAWGSSNRLNLTCLHARFVRSPHTAHWLFLDKGLRGVLKDKPVRSLDDGRILRLVASADNDLRGFYTCRAHTNKRTRNIVTYGVVGKIRYNLTGPDTATAIAVTTTIALVAVTLSWLVIEGINDLRNGFGFFRDAHLTPAEEAEAVCKYIDDNMHLVRSESDAEIAKARARRKARHLASRSSFGAQEPQGFLQIGNEDVSEGSTPSDLDELPALPEAKSSVAEAPSPRVFRCEPSYISSPRHGSNISSPRSRLASSSSFDLSSPRLLCTRLLLAKRIHFSKENILSKRSRVTRKYTPRKIRSNLLTIKSSRCVNLSPGEKILQRFRQLKSDDF